MKNNDFSHAPHEFFFCCESASSEILVHVYYVIRRAGDSDYQPIDIRNDLKICPVVNFSEMMNNVIKVAKAGSMVMLSFLFGML